MFLPKMLPKTLTESFERTLEKLFGKLPREIIYLDSVDSVSLFLRSNECFTISTGWNTDIRSENSYHSAAAFYRLLCGLASGSGKQP